jgi:hypothetical protein
VASLKEKVGSARDRNHTNDLTMIRAIAQAFKQYRTIAAFDHFFARKHFCEQARTFLNGYGQDDLRNS